LVVVGPAARLRATFALRLLTRLRRRGHHSVGSRNVSSACATASAPQPSRTARRNRPRGRAESVGVGNRPPVDAHRPPWGCRWRAKGAPSLGRSPPFSATSTALTS